MKWLLGWAINAGVLLLMPYILPAVQVRDFGAALIAALVLGLLNAIMRPILVVLTLPVTMLTLGLFILVINGLMFWLASRLLDGFQVASFGWAIVAALLFSLISWVVSTVVLRRDA
ncbi:MAG: phage holin family protein [Burkholderiales bacterium]|nr:phage holin family protein [Burkholderiales bacterium]